MPGLPASPTSPRGPNNEARSYCGARVVVVVVVGGTTFTFTFPVNGHSSSLHLTFPLTQIHIAHSSNPERNSSLSLYQFPKYKQEYNAIFDPDSGGFDVTVITGAAVIYQWILIFEQ